MGLILIKCLHSWQATQRQSYITLFRNIPKYIAENDNHLFLQNMSVLAMRGVLLVSVSLALTKKLKLYLYVDPNIVEVPQQNAPRRQRRKAVLLYCPL